MTTVIAEGSDHVFRLTGGVLQSGGRGGETRHQCTDQAHHLKPQKYRIHIRSLGLSSSSELHTLTISTADGNVWVTEASFPFRCIEEEDPFGTDAFHTIVADHMKELVRKVRQPGHPL